MSCEKTLRGRGLRLTPQRLLVADIIHDAGRQFTAGELVKHVQEKMPGVNKSTVYRTLELLEEAGCVYRSGSDSESTYHHDDEGHRHHLVCRRCGRAVDCRDDIFAALRTSLARRYGFQAELEHVTVSGLCRSCRKKTG